MATPPTPQPTAEGIQQQLEATQQALQQVQETPVVETPKPEQKFVIETSTGQRFIGKTQAEVISEMQKSIENASSELKRLHELEKRGFQPEPPPSPEAAAELQARKWMADNLAQELGFANANEMKEAVGGMRMTTQEIQQQRVVAEFHSMCPDFPADDVASEKLQEVFKREALPFSPAGLRAAHKIAVAEGLYAPVNSTPAQSPSAPPLPAVAGGAPLPSVGQQDVWNMSTDQLRALIEKGGR